MTIIAEWRNYKKAIGNYKKCYDIRILYETTYFLVKKNLKAYRQVILTSIDLKNYKECTIVKQLGLYIVGF